jgi:hypothetical protein
MSLLSMVRIATLAMVAGCATALCPTAFGQPQSDWTQVPPPPLPSQRVEKTWVGSASCNVIASSPKKDVNYEGAEFHKWEIIPWLIYTDSKDRFYAENWTANGGGKNGQNQNWTVNAKGPTPGYLQFWLPTASSLLHVRRWSSAQEDPNGITTASTGTAIPAVKEIDFPGPVSAAAGIPIQSKAVRRGRPLAASSLMNQVMASMFGSVAGILNINRPAR